MALEQGKTKVADAPRADEAAAIAVRLPIVAMTADRFSSPAVLSLAVVYFLMFGALGAEVSFLPNVLAINGLSARDVGLVLSVGILAQILGAPIAGEIADRYGARLVLVSAAVAAAASLLLLSTTSGRVASTMPVFVLFALASAPLNPLVDAIAVPACQHVGVPYGRVRGAGSLGFLTGILLSSTIAERLGIRSPILTAAVLFVLLAMAIPMLPATARRSEARRAKGAIRTLFGIKAYRRILVVAALVIGSHAMSDALAVIYWQANGISIGTIGNILAFAVFAELLAFTTIGPLLVERLGPSGCAVFGALVGASGWVILAVSSNVWLALLTQLLHGLMFALVHLACMQVMPRVAPARFFATAQGLYGICINAIASAVVTFTGSALYDAMHGYVFLLASALCMLAIPVALRLSTDEAAPS